jgi:hypothetical protein
METNLDLDIHNYTISDIETFFRFKKNQSYTSIDVELRENEIRQQLLSSGHINKRFKRDLIEFLTTAKDWLIHVMCKPTETPSLIPQGYKLDKMDTPLSAEPPSSREVYVINREETEAHKKSEYFHGHLNPLNRRVVVKSLNIDTRFRRDITQPSSDFIINLPEKYHNVVSMQFSEIEIPICFYGISAAYGNNNFGIWINSSYTLITVPDGNYTASDLTATINRDLSGNGEPFSWISISSDLTAGGSGTGKTMMQLSSLGVTKLGLNNPVIPIIVTLDFAPDFNTQLATNYDLTMRLGYNLGFQRQKYTYGFSEAFQTLYSETVIEAFAFRYIYISVEDFNNSVNSLFNNAFEQVLADPNILARVSIRSPFFNVMMDTASNILTEPRKYFGPVDIQRLRIRVYDEHGRILNMNNSNFSFCLRFKMLYE